MAALTRLAMGWSWAPYIAQSVFVELLAAAGVENSSTFSAHVWIDNLALWGRAEEVLAAWGRVKAVFADLNITYHELDMGRNPVFVGLAFDLAAGQYWLAKGHELEARLDHWNQALTSWELARSQGSPLTAPLREAQRAAGTMVWSLYVGGGPLGFLPIRDTLAFISEITHTPNTHVSVARLRQEAQAVQALVGQRWALPAVSQWDNMTVLWTDASLQGGGYEVWEPGAPPRGKGWAWEPPEHSAYLEGFPPPLESGAMTYWEGLALLHGIQEEKGRIPFSSRGLLLCVDNQALVSILKRGWTPCRWLQGLIGALLGLLATTADWRIIWVPTHRNPADPWSRQG